MIRNIRIGLSIVGDKDWMGGVIYLEHLAHAIAMLEQNRRPPLYLIVKEENLDSYALHSRVIKYLDGVIFWGKDCDQAKQFLPADFRHCINIQELLAHIDFIYPVISGVPDWCCSAEWIPDFQHVHLPRFFSQQEIDNRNKWFGRVAEDTSLLVLSSQSAKRDFLRIYPQAKVMIRTLPFYLFPEKDWYLPDPIQIQKKYNLPDLFLICCNQFWIHKNHKLLFKAIAALNMKSLKVHLVCTGSTKDSRCPEYFSDLKHILQSLEIEEQVHILGKIPRLDQIQLIRRSVMVVQPSLFEGWSTVVEDSRSLGKRMLLSDLDVHMEQSPKNAVYFDRTSVTDLETKIQQSLPTLSCGPNRLRESEANTEAVKLVKEYGERFCNIAIEAQFICNHKIRGISNEL